MHRSTQDPWSWWIRAAISVAIPGSLVGAVIAEERDTAASLAIGAWLLLMALVVPRNTPQAPVWSLGLIAVTCAGDQMGRLAVDGVYLLVQHGVGGAAGSLGAIGQVVGHASQSRAKGDSERAATGGSGQHPSVASSHQSLKPRWCTISDRVEESSRVPARAAGAGPIRSAMHDPTLSARGPFGLSRT